MPAIVPTKPGAHSSKPFEPELVYVPAGPFAMGTSEREIDYLARRYEWARRGRRDGWFDPEKPQHQVTLSGYWIGRFPITNQEFESFVRRTGKKPPSHWTARRPPADTLDHPVVGVDWHAAQEYVAWLRQQTGRPYRLPTEAEWEKAARGTERRIWPWGKEPPDGLRCTPDESVGATTPVGYYSPAGDSPYGCADMAGNIWEWCHSLHKPYLYDAGDGREDTAAPGPRVVRGGSFAYEGDARCAVRYSNFPDYSNWFHGFRVVMAPLPTDL